MIDISCFDTYIHRYHADDKTMREEIVQRERRTIALKMKKSLDYKKDVTIDGRKRDCLIVRGKTPESKYLYTLDNFRAGAVVEFANEHWLIQDKEADNELYYRGILLRCNYLLRWIDNGKIIQRWVNVEDGTSYLTGEYSDNYLFATRGDTRIKLTIGKDEFTKRLTRDTRFIVDDYDKQSGTVMAYRLTKPLGIGNIHNGEGVYSFIISECALEEDDNVLLKVADYYKHFPRTDNSVVEGGYELPDRKKVWL